MTFCWKARAKIDDADDYERYTDPVLAVMAKYDGKVLARPILAGAPFDR